MDQCRRTAVRGSPRRGRWAVVLVLCSALGLAALPAATFTVAVDRDTAVVGESVTLSLNFEGGSPRTVPLPSAEPNLRVQYLGPENRFEMINGAVRASVTHKFQVTAQQPGEYTIPALRAEVDGQVLTSPPLTLRFVAAQAAAGAADQQLVWAQLIVPKSELFVGETVGIEVRLYVHSQVRGIEHFQMSPLQAEGLAVGKWIEGARGQTRVGNAVFTVVPLRAALTAHQAGPMTLGPVQCSATVQLPAAGRRRDFFDPFGMFERTEGRAVTFATGTAPVTVLPLPATNVPAGFNGAVGSYEMQLTAAPTNVAVGDPITVRIQISGRGRMETLSLPDLPAWREFKLYPPTSRVETTDALGLQGSKVFELILTPQNAELRELPPIAFSFFDPEQRAYRTLRSPAVPLGVRPAAALPEPTVLAGTRATPPAAPEDLRHIKPRPGVVAVVRPPVAQQGWFWAVQGVPVLIWAASWGWRKRVEALARNPRLRRQRHVARVLRTGLRQLPRLAAAKDSEAFFATVFRLLQEQIGERLDVPASAITEAVIEEQLHPHGLADTACARLRELFHACNQARYAPGCTDQELAAWIPALQTALAELQQFKPTGCGASRPEAVSRAE